MPQELLGVQWRDQNQATTYPFLETATLASDDGRTLLEGVFLDAALYPVGGTAGLYLTAITVTTTAITVAVGTEAVPQLCTATFAPGAAPDRLDLRDAFNRPAGLLLSSGGQLALLQSFGLGVHAFRRTATEFVPSVVIPTPEVGLRGILLDDGSLLTGNVWILGGDGVVVRGGTTAAEIRIDVVGDPLHRRRLCSGGGFTTPNPITQLRVTSPQGSWTVVPDAQGQIQIMTADTEAADSVLRVASDGTGLTIAAVGATLGSGEA